MPLVIKSEPTQRDMEIYNNKYAFDEKLLAAVAFFSEDSIVITDTQLDAPGPRIVYVNPGFTKMTGYGPEEILGKSPRFLQGPKTDRAVLGEIRRKLNNNEVFFGQAVNYRKDGSEFINEWHIEPIRSDEGKVTHYLAIQHDATERVKAQQAIEQKNMALREILEQIEIEKKKIKSDVMLNVEKILLPALKKLRRKGTKLDKTYIDILENNLKDLTSSFGSAAAGNHLKLSPREVEIANLIRNGLSSKEICEMLNVSYKTIETHRNKIRKKLGIVNSEVNITTYLQNV